MTENNNTPTRFGFAAVIGAPNAGKSTLINQIVGAKISIVTPKVQTTRMRVLGIAAEDQSQIVFIDTPGIFAPKKRLEKAMVEAAWQGMAEADLTMLLIDAARKGPGEDNAQILKELSRREVRRAVLVLNKIDLVPKEKLLAFAAELNGQFDFEATFMVSALTGNGVRELTGWLAGQLPEGPWMYPEDQISNLPLRMNAAEITREKLFLNLHKELPYGLTVETESWEEFDNGSVKISQLIHIARENHKPIILGKGGAMIKTVGQQARQELEDILECRVHLKLFVKVNEKWAEDPDMYRLMGLDFSV